MIKYWISCNKFTVQVDTDENFIIKNAAPIVKVFIGQPFLNLIRWSRKFGGLYYEEIKI